MLSLYAQVATRSRCIGKKSYTASIISQFNDSSSPQPAKPVLTVGVFFQKCFVHITSGHIVKNRRYSHVIIINPK